MNLKNNIFTALLLAIGFILHQITPGLFGGMKFDFLLSFIFISLLINSSLKNTILTGLLGGLLSSITTTFPGGQIPNIIDKLVTCILLYIVIKLFKHFNFNFNILIIGFISALGTIISGTVFLLSAFLIIGLPAPFTLLLITVVLPTTLINTVVTTFIYKITKYAMNISGLNLRQL